MKPKKPVYRRAYRLVAAKPEKSEGPKWHGILVKDYFPVIGSMVAIFSVIATVAAGYINTQNQQRTNTLETDQKLLNDQFVDVQNRLSKTDNVSERVNAVYSLVEIAQRPDPRYRDAPDDAALAERLGLPSAWVGKLAVDHALRPCPAAYPYFKPAVLRLASVVLLDSDQAVRDAALRGARALGVFSTREIKGLTWADFERLPADVTAVPMTKFLVETLAQANRDAWSQWRDGLARFMGTAQAIGAVKTASSNAPPIQWDSPLWKAQRDTARQLGIARWLPKPTGSDPAKMGYQPAYIWQLLKALSPIVSASNDSAADGLGTDVLLETMGLRNFNANLSPIGRDDSFDIDVMIRRQVVGSSKISEWPGAWQEQQRTFRSISARFLAARDALAGVLRVIDFQKEQYPEAVQSLLDTEGSETPASKEPRPDLQSAADGWIHVRFGFDLSHCWFPDADLSGAELPGSLLSYSHLQRANLSSARLMGANMDHTNLSGAIISHAELPLVDLTRARCPEISAGQSQMIGANLRNAVLNDADFEGANLSRAKVFKGSAHWTEKASKGPDLLPS